MVKSLVLPVAALLPLATAALYPGVTSDNHTCVLSAFFTLAPDPMFLARFQNGLSKPHANQLSTPLVGEPVLSCSADATPAKVDTCCSETFGGLVVCIGFPAWRKLGVITCLVGH